jgi:predicted nucleic acid-binding protein
MISVDASSLRRYFDGATGPDVDLIIKAAAEGIIQIAPVVITEILSDASLDHRFVRQLLAIPFLEIIDGYWIRAGHLRGQLLARGYKVRVVDTLIAQSCIDHQIPLITHDRDFRHFVKAGLKLL